MSNELKIEAFSVVDFTNYLHNPNLTGEVVFIFFADLNLKKNSLVGFYSDYDKILRKNYLSVTEKSLNERIWIDFKNELFAIAKQQGFKYALPDFFVIEIVEELILDSGELTFDEYIHVHFNEIFKFIKEVFDEIQSDRFYEPL
jgi:hypothetical protein